MMTYTKSNPLQVVTLCSGYDSQCMALDRIGIPYELKNWAEIDKYAIQAHNLNYPQWADRNLGDMSVIDWTKVDGRIDLLTYSTPCLTADSLVLTRNGYKPIIDVEVGEEVLTKSNTWHKVAKKFDNGVHPTIFIKALGFDSIHCTPNHKFWVRRMKRVWHNDVRRWMREFSEPEFVMAKDLDKSCYLGMPREFSESLPEWDGVILNYGGRDSYRTNELSSKFTEPDFWYIMGRYVGDGWIRDDETHKQVLICCSFDETEELEDRIINAGFKYVKTTERTTTRFAINSKELMEFVKRYGRYAYGKKIDGETMALPVSLCSAFLNGYVESDGSFVKGEYKITTVSRELAYGISFLVNKVYRIHCRFYFHKARPKTTIEGRGVNQRDQYQLVWHTEHRKQDHAFYEDGYIWYPFKETLSGEDENVYNMEVEEDHSYIVQGCISKNCQDISNAGLQRGIEENSGTRSSLLWFTRNAILAKKPRYLMLENVKALVSKKFMPGFQKWLDELESYGYKSFWKVLNAKDYGVPQNRERVFVISILKTEDDPDPQFFFPEPFPLEKRLMDILEPKVDEKYYLAKKSLDYFFQNAEVQYDAEE